MRIRRSRKTVREEVSLLTPCIRPLRVLSAAGVVVLLAYAALWWLLDMPGNSYRGPLAPLTPAQAAIEGGLKSHVRALAVEIGERNLAHPGSLDRTLSYIADRLNSWGYGARYHEYIYAKQAFKNVVAEIPGEELAHEIVIAGAHYDSVVGTVGANDNASGVAVTLELARLLREAKPKRTLRFLFFVNEEPPYFQGEGMGSRAYARDCRSRGEEVVAVLSMETMGYYRDQPGTQKFPVPLLSLFYPDTGNFIAFVGNLASRSLVRESVKAFREAAAFPSQGIAAPEVIPGIGWSDHWSFWQEGYPGLMVTDTAPFRDPNYHSGSDLPANIDYARLARVTAGLEGVVRRLGR